MNKQTSLYDFGYNFLGPICSEYFYSLKQRCEDIIPDRILFLAREGYFFNRVYSELVDQGFLKAFPCNYLYVSRTFLFRISIGDQLSWKSSLSHSYYGDLQGLLVGRFGFSFSEVERIFSASELNTNWYLPFEQAQLELLFINHLDSLKELVQKTRSNYLDYLKSVDISDAKNPIMVDVGYAGTIQKLLTNLLNINTQGLYFIATQEGEHKVNDHTATIKSVFKHGVKMQDGYTMLDRSLFLESLLTSPEGQFIDIIKKSVNNETSYEFLFGRKGYTQKNFQELDLVFKGAQAAVLDAFKKNVRYSIDEIEMMYETYAYRRDMFPRATWHLFDVDDAISGNANVNPLSLFRL
jgi:hypothetical protein